MSQVSDIVNALKRLLKARGMRYAELASIIGVSEATVKRMFSEQQLTLSRLDCICQAIDIEFADLIANMEQQRNRLERLSIEQEKELASNMPLLLVTISVMNGYSYEELCQRFNLRETECIQALAKLDSLNVIELLPHNKIRLRIAPNFAWQPGGPIQQFFMQRVQQEFFRSKFDRDNEQLLVLNGLLTQHSNQELQKKMRHLAHEFNQLMQQDKQHRLEDRDGVTMVLALAPWTAEVFSDYTKPIQQS